MLNLCEKPRRALLVAPISLLLLGLGLSGCATQNVAPSAGSQSADTRFDPALHALLPDEVQRTGILRAGVSTTGAPFSSKDGDNVVGIIPDLAREVEAILGVKISWVEGAFAGLIPAAQSGKTDIIWAAMIDTLKREEVLDFVPYVGSSDSLLVPAGNPHGIETLASLCGLAVGTARGSVEAQLLEEQQQRCRDEGRPDLGINLYDTQGETQTQLRAGKIDADLGTTISMRYVAARFESEKTFEVLPGTYPQDPFSVGIPKGNDDLARALQGALSRVIASDRYLEILKDHDAGTEGITADSVTINPVGTAARNG